MTARLDALLVSEGFFATRSRARDAILRGTVLVDGVAATKPGQTVDPARALTVNDAAQGYVSRAALKLLHALDGFGIDAGGADALDVGASTGGFTQVLLERGAARVTALDVGHGQLAECLRKDHRITMLEGLNARDLAPADLSGPAPGLVVSDVSFISLKLALPPALALAAPGARAVLLVKPQFEAGRERIGKNGLLRDEADAARVADDLFAWLNTVPGWKATGLLPSPILGGEGAREFLLAGRKTR